MAALWRASALLTALLTALDVAYLLPVNRSYKALAGAEYTRAHGSMVRVAGPTAPLLAGPLLATDAVLLVKLRRAADRTSGWVAASLALVLVNGAVTFAVNVPINRKFAGAPGHAPPEGWQELRDRWALAHDVRTAAQILSLAALVGGWTRRPEGN